jgi:SAM-dependent methyltransferase
MRFGDYRRRATHLARQILSRDAGGEWDELALPAYSHNNPIARWLFWRRLWHVARFFKQTMPPGCRVLDFGCGVGMLIPLLRAQGLQCVGVDRDLRATTDFLSQFGWQDTPLFDVSEWEFLPPRSFDAITALDVLEHVPQLHAIVHRLLGLLKPHGVCVVCGPTESRLYRVGRWMAGFDGRYHVRDIADIRQAFDSVATTRTIASLYPGLSLFCIFAASTQAART